jgi:dihydrofolate reductase
MRKIRYQVACSLDGYIADAAGETGWIVDEPAIDFAELYEQFDTLLMGRLTYESLRDSSDDFWGKKVFVFSQTLRQEDHLAVTVVSEDVENTLKRLRALPGKDIWLFGGGQLCQSLLALGCVDTVEPAIIPVLLGGGRPFLPSPASQTVLALTAHRVFPSGIVWLEYTVQRPEQSLPAPLHESYS